MLRYRNRMQYSEKAIYALCRTQHSVYHGRKSFLVIIVSIVFLSLAATVDMPIWGKTALLALCGISISFASYPPVYKAKATVRSLHGDYPLSEFFFRDEDLLIRCKKEEKRLEYGIFTRIQYDEDYVYLFIGKTQAYMLDNAQFLPADRDGFLAFISEKTGKFAYRSRKSNKLGLKSILMQKK